MKSVTTTPSDRAGTQNAQHSALPANPRIPAAWRGSAAWHACMLAGTALAPAHWPLWLGGMAANHLILSGAGVMPRSALLGPNIRRLPPCASARHEMALTFDDGPDPQVTPLVLDRLAAAGMHASFFCVGERVRAHAALARRIIAAGHSIENHTDSHSHRFAFRGMRGLHRDIADAQHTIADITGIPPRFFRAPAGMRNPLLQSVLAPLDLRLTSWTRRGFDTVESDAGRVLQRLGSGLAAGDILLLHDGNAKRSASGEPLMLPVLDALLNRIAAAGLTGVTLPGAFRAGTRP